MTAAALRSSFRAADRVDHSPACSSVSQSDLLADGLADVSPKAPVRRSAAPMANVARLHSIDGHEFRLWFAPQFACFLRNRFQTPEQVAVAFAVRPSTAWNWWNGDNRATGDAVARMFVAFPDAVSWFLAAWEGRE